MNGLVNGTPDVLIELLEQLTNIVADPFTCIRLSEEAREESKVVSTHRNLKQKNSTREQSICIP